MIRVTRSLLMLTVGAASITPMLHAADLPTTSNTVFVMTNDADKNEVLAYQRLFDGRLILNERYATGGRGSGGTTDPLGSQGSLTLSQDHSLLFAVNAGSGTLTEFRVRGSVLQLADKEPTGGAEPVAVAQYKNLVYVLNAGGSGNVVGFHINGNGHLNSIPNSTAFLSTSGAGGASIAISPDGQFLVVTERVANNIDTFHINSDGTLAKIVVNPSPGAGTFAGTFAPDGKYIVSETGPAGGSNASGISSYTIQANGSISAVTQSLPTLGNANCWNAVTPNGKYVYASNSASSTIAGFSIGAGGALTPIGGTILGSNPAGATNLDLAVSGDGKYLYSIDSGAGAISIFGINSDGSLTNLGDISGLPKTVGFNGIAAL
jgi:6-phosphogluconolactonase